MSAKTQERPSRPRKRRWIVLAVIVLVVMGIWTTFRSPIVVEPGTVLVLDLGAGLPERAPGSLEQLLGASAFDLLGLHKTLGAALVDTRVDGIVVRLGDGYLGGATVEEVRARLEDFRRADKFVVAYSSGADTLSYLLATAADEIIQDPTTSLNTTGLRLTSLFFKDLLENYGVKADLLRVGKYKGTFEQFSLSEPTADYSTAMNGLADSLYSSVVSEIARRRTLEEEQVRTLIDRSPLTAEEARREKLVDRVLFPDELELHLETLLSERGDRELHLLSVEEYASRRAEQPGRRHLAVVHVAGMIVEGESRHLTLTGEACGAATVVSALEDALDNRDVAGILLRIDSPGGLVTASEKIWRAVERAAKKKPIVASLANTAASGGYYVACAADKVLAHGMSLTGSIGVFGGKVVLEDLLRRQGLTVHTYSRGEHASMFDFDRPFQPGERLHLERMLEESYRTFVERVSTKRAIAAPEIASVAEGRVWSGLQARRIGLVDALGGYSAAARELRQLASIPAEEPLGLQAYPAAPTVWDLLTGAGRERLAGRGRFGAARASELVRSWLRECRFFESARGLALMPFALELR